MPRSLDRAQRSEYKKIERLWREGGREGGWYTRVVTSVRGWRHNVSRHLRGGAPRRKGKGRMEERRDSIGQGEERWTTREARAILLLDKQMNSSDNSWPGCR